MKRSRITILVLVLLVVIIVGLAIGSRSAWHSSVPATNGSSPGAGTGSASSTPAPAVNAVAGYDLPDGWQPASCSSQPAVVYAVPPGASANCAADPAAPVSLRFDPNHTADCGQLYAGQDVHKHVCQSLYINGSRSLQSETVYGQSPSGRGGLSVADYYIPVGHDVIQVEYRYRGDASYQAQFDQIAHSVRAKK